MRVGCCTQLLYGMTRANKNAVESGLMSPGEFQRLLRLRVTKPELDVAKSADVGLHQGGRSESIGSIGITRLPTAISVEGKPGYTRPQAFSLLRLLAEVVGAHITWWTWYIYRK